VVGILAGRTVLVQARESFFAIDDAFTRLWMWPETGGNMGNMLFI
jgi:hypothetical protein